MTFDALLDAAARSPLLPRGVSTLAAAATQHGQTHRPDSGGGGGHLRLEAPSRLRTAALWAAEQSLGHLGPRSAALEPLRGAA